MTVQANTPIKLNFQYYSKNISNNTENKLN